MPPQKKVPRRVRLIKPGIQLKLCLVFLAVGVTCVMMQFALLSESLTRIAMQSTSPGLVMAGSIHDALWKHLLITLALLGPLTLAIGILVTHRVAGPIYRFETYLKSVARGEPVGRCHIRKGDECQDLCAAINDAVDALKRREPSRLTGESAEQQPTPVAAE